MGKDTKWRRLGRLLEIPDEAAFGSLKLTMLENRELLVENHQGIVAYTEEKVKIKVPFGWLTVTGESLNLNHLQSEQILLKGRIVSLYYGE